ncbi:MAG: hypothetical protein AABW90_01520 [Nanoarchaeota archaeon]
MKISNKAQITIFIILAIIIIISLILFFSVKSVSKEEKVSPQIASVYSFVDNCIEKTGEDAIYNIGQTGGYFLYSNKSTESGIAYYFDKNKKLIISKEEVENQLSLYINEMLFFCTKNFVGFPDFEVSQGEIKTKTKIVKDKVILTVNYPLTISKNDKSYFIKNFEKQIPSRLDTIYKVASGITEEQMLDFENICINCVSDLAFENKVFVSMNDDIYDKNTIIFTIIDDQYKINGQDYRFYFANRYDLG